MLLLLVALAGGSKGEYEQGFCDVNGYGCGPVDTIVWDRTMGTEPTFPDSLILQPDEVKKITKTVLKMKRGYKGYNAECGWTEWYTAWDNNDAPIMVSIDKFLSAAKVAYMREQALAAKWEPAQIHESKLTNIDTSDIRKGNGFPGMRVDANSKDDRTIKACLRPIIRHTAPNFPFDRLRETQTLFGLVTNKFQPQQVWLDAQRMPHNDIKWHYGVDRQTDEVAGSFASVYPLTTEFNQSGTAIFREKATGKSLLKNLADNNAAQGNFNPHYEKRLHPELNFLDTITDPYPHNLANQADNPWVQIIMVAYLRYNRFTLYDGRRLHNQYFEGPDYERLSGDPAQGRLTMNGFFWDEV